MSANSLILYIFHFYQVQHFVWTFFDIYAIILTELIARFNDRLQKLACFDESCYRFLFIYGFQFDNIFLYQTYEHRRSIVGDIIELKPEQYKRRMSKMKYGLLEDLKGVHSRVYSPAEIETKACTVLSATDLYPQRSAVPIVKIADRFEIDVYEYELEEDFPGDIRVNGDTAKYFDRDRVILVSAREDIFRKRFLAAHELAHYIYEFPWDPSYKNPSLLFSDKYHKDHHETLEEKRANRFAAAILMPKDLFVNQYHIARNEDGNEMFIMMYLSRFFRSEEHTSELQSL